MKIDLIKDGRNATVAISGRIDTTTAPQSRAFLQPVDFGGMDAVVMDFGGVEYISSAGLRELLVTKKAYLDKPFRILNVKPTVAEIFDITGFSSFFELGTSADGCDYSSMSFKAFLNAKAAGGGDKVILEDKTHRYTWEDIDKASQIIASDLSKKGVRAGTHAAICGSNSINWALTFYAIQKLGAIAILVNFNLTPQEIVRIAKAGDITFFCYGNMTAADDEASFIRAITGADSPITDTYSIQNDFELQERICEYEALKDRFSNVVEADDACVMVFTSGSTGSPKGALLSAYNVLNAASSNAESIRLTEHDTACLILPLFHIFGLIAGLFANAVANATLYFPNDVRTSEILKTVSEKNCTVMHAVPTMLLALINNPDFKTELVKTLRSTILSGAPVSGAQIMMLQDRFPGIHFAASYGMSEMAPISITDYGDSREHITQTVGRPVKNIQISIFDRETGAECPAGTSGEIVVQGYNLMCCYYKVPIELQAIDEKGWMHTGDLGFMDQDGYLHFLSRCKELIIRGGENIVPNEVAAAIAADERVCDVKVIGLPDDFLGEIVAAAVIMKAGAAFDEDGLKSRLKGALAKYKIPALIVPYERFSSLPNGKIDMMTLKKEMADYRLRIKS